MNFIILKKRSEYNKRYYANPADNKETLLYKANKCAKLIVEAKEKHLAKLSSKLDDPDTAPKTYWSIINKYLNNKKIPIMLSVFFEGKLISDFEKKVKLLSSHFAPQCSLVKNSSTLPNLEYKIDEPFSYFNINENNFRKNAH